MKKSHVKTPDGTMLCGAQSKRVPPSGMPPTCAACQNGGKPPQPVRRPQILTGTIKHVPAGDPDYTKTCDVCGGTPVVPETGMCGPCTFGEAETVGGNW